MRTLIQDLRYGLRMLAKNRSFIPSGAPPPFPNRDPSEAPAHEE